ncbi:DNA polymerase epsilon subunit 2 isoform X3 [Hydra vulgaris]|uniref:DNA polymerase epsilon subunit n=1 Tax=Hydra vulgaris TaxID=6087 RepID=A0ABM4BTF6_HYDVU
MSGIQVKVLHAFKLNGLSLRSEASKFLIETLENLDSGEVDTWLRRVIEIVQKQPLDNVFIDRTVLEHAVAECKEGNDDTGDRVFNFIDAFSVPHYTYNVERKKFMLDSNRKPCLNGLADDKANMFVERYMLLYQRTMHHELFTPSAFAASSNVKSAKFTLKPVEHLLGCSGNLGDIIVFGMLTRLKEDKYFLEDPSGVVELDLSKTVFHTGLYTENCFVLAEGSYDDQVFHVSALGFPPLEKAATTRSFFGNINFFGGPSSVCVASSEKLKQLEQDDVNQNNMFVFISDLWLDNPKVISNFKTLLSGYASMPPALFVICGNFLSQYCGTKQLMQLKQGFDELAQLISEFDEILESSRFVFIPGPQDLGPANILPRPPLSKMVSEKLKEKVPFAYFLSNPCRIQYCSQEIVIYREDIVNKMCRNSLHLPTDLQDIPSHFAKTLLSQSHLCPLPLHIRPIYWCFDNALRLYPLPDVVVCADKYEGYNVNISDTIFMNPGSFSRNDCVFKVYWPATKELEECKITS